MGTSWTLASKQHQIFYRMKNIIKNICIFQITFSQWRAALWKKIFWDVFLRLASCVFMKNFRFHSPALQFFCKKMPHLSSYLWGKYFYTKIFTVLHQSKKELSDLDQNWAKTRHLLFKTWKSSISMDSPIVHWEAIYIFEFKLIVMGIWHRMKDL